MNTVLTAAVHCNNIGPHGAVCVLAPKHKGSHWGSTFFSWLKEKANRA